MIPGDSVLWAHGDSIGAGRVTEVHDDWIQVSHVGGVGCFRPGDLLPVSDVLDVLDAHEVSGDSDGPFGVYCPSCDEDQAERGAARHKPDCGWSRAMAVLRAMAPGWPREGAGR